MILLDTNYLIRALVAGTSEAARLAHWLASDTELCTSAICWYEFVCGPVDDQGLLVMESILDRRILPFVMDHAMEASRLFNATGRLRQLRVDAMIAATAILANAELATGNAEDFKAFVPCGLRMASQEILAEK
jgi:predicted nucleic acid-binding protein